MAVRSGGAAVTVHRQGGLPGRRRCGAAGVGADVRRRVRHGGRAHVRIRVRKTTPFQPAHEMALRLGMPVRLARWRWGHVRLLLRRGVAPARHAESDLVHGCLFRGDTLAHVGDAAL